MHRRRSRILPALILALIFITTPVLAGEAEFTFTNGFDGTEQKAMSYVPDGMGDKDARPLLVVAHYMGGDRFTARKSGYYPECDERGWRCVCPELHGRRTPGQTSSAALEAQHDVMGAIAYMKETYAVDGTRIYIVGRSMGGMLSQVMAAKYPDVFACAVSGEGISDLPLWYRTTTPHLKKSIVAECGELTEDTRFDYERRSSVNFAPNLRYTPLILWHGTNDTWVPPEQSERIVGEVRKYNRFQPEPHWLLNAAHCPENYTAGWVCDRLTWYQNVPEAGFDTPFRYYPDLEIVTDEAKSYFWLHLVPADEEAFARASVNLSHDVLYVRTDNVREAVIDLGLTKKGTTLSSYDIGGDIDVTVRVVKDGAELFELTTQVTSIGSFDTPLSR